MGDPSSSRSSDSSPACAACNHLHLRCNSDCPWARYFPANRASEVIMVDKHLGLARFLELLNQVPPEFRDHMAESLIFEARARWRDPVHASAGIVHHLIERIESTKKELQSVRQHLTQIRAQHSPTSSVRFQLLLLLLLFT
ncbi:putative transcription factor AS2-LOB family [Dioscorea sansibarensis]